MKSAFVFLALVALSQGVPMSRGISERIVNGNNAKPGEIPYQVSLQLRDSDFHFCGGSILNKDYVITAAHCVDGQYARNVKIIAGSVSLDDPQAVHYAVKIVIHERYNPANSWINDIALIKSDLPFEMSKSLSSVPLPQRGQIIPANTVAVVSGWGRLWQGGAVPRKLQRAEILIAAQDYCQRIYDTQGYPIYDTQICANDPDVETGSCNGDSGGPLTVEGTLVGLVSWANGCANIEFPTVFTRVAEYIDWINRHAI